MARHSGLALISWRTCSPSTLGNFKSSKTSFGGRLGERPLKAPRQNRKSRASSPSRTTSIRLFRLSLWSARRVSSTSCGSSSTSRISITSSVILSFPHKNRLVASIRRRLPETEKERSAFIEFRFGPDAATVLANNSLHGRQSHAGAFEVLPPVQALKDA